MTEFTGDKKRLIDNLHTRVAREVMRTSGQSILELARHWAQEGQPSFTADLLQFIDVSDQVKREILANSYENEAVIKMAFGQILNKHTGTDAGYSLEAEASLVRASALLREPKKLER